MEKNILKFFILLFLVALVSSTFYRCNKRSPCGCSKNNVVSINQRIVGGETAANKSWEWMLTLLYNNRLRCGASLLNNEYAVTAAHCVMGKAPSSLSIRAGSNYLSVSSGSGIQTRVLKAIYLHPQYDDNLLDNDIAVIKFEPLRNDDAWKLAPICLPLYRKDPFLPGSKLVATGWGDTQEDGEISDALQQVTVRVIGANTSSCIQAPIVNPRYRFCAGLEEGGKDTCQGDSGGPILSFRNGRWVLAGITSSGEGCARPTYPGLYTRVSTYVRFIQSIMKAQISI